MKRYLATFFVLLAVIGVMGTYVFISWMEKNQPINPEVKEVITQNVESLNRKDLDAYLNTLSKSSPLYDATGTAIKSLFEKYDVQTQIEDYKQKQSLEFDSTVEVKLKTSLTPKISGVEARTIETVNVFRLVNDGGEGWKILDSKITSSKDLGKKE